MSKPKLQKDPKARMFVYDQYLPVSPWLFAPGQGRDGLALSGNDGSGVCGHLVPPCLKGTHFTIFTW